MLDNVKDPSTFCDDWHHTLLEKVRFLFTSKCLTLKPLQHSPVFQVLWMRLNCFFDILDDLLIFCFYQPDNRNQSITRRDPQGPYLNP